jgi:hypothetical protein
MDDPSPLFKLDLSWVKKGMDVGWAKGEGRFGKLSTLQLKPIINGIAVTRFPLTFFDFFLANTCYSPLFANTKNNQCTLF